MVSTRPAIEPRLLLILGAPRSFTTIVSNMLGQHPRMYALPETNLFTAEDIEEWWQRSTQVEFRMTDGLRRAVAQIFFGLQTEETIRRAAGWLWRRSSCSTAYVLELLIEQLAPRTVIEKSPSTVHSEAWLRRTVETFPGAMFLHLVRHPRGYCESVMKQLKRWDGKSRQPPSWLANLATYQRNSARGRQLDASSLDPQKSWYSLNMMIARFLSSVPEKQKLRIRGEDILMSPDSVLPQICSWLGMASDQKTVEAMKHPECSPYAFFGPASAPMGNDHLFLEDPHLRPAHARQMDLESPLNWNASRKGFAVETKELARQFGYSG
jgi:Sulfotransferase family